MINRIIAKISVGSGSEYKVNVYSGAQYFGVPSNSFLQDVTLEFQSENDAKSFMNDFRNKAHEGIQIKGARND